MTRVVPLAGAPASSLTRGAGEQLHVVDLDVAGVLSEIEGKAGSLRAEAFFYS